MNEGSTSENSENAKENTQKATATKKESTMKTAKQNAHTPRIRTRAGAVRRYNAILSRHFRETRVPHVRGLFDQSWDWPTLRICYPTTARKLETVGRIFELLKK